MAARFVLVSLLLASGPEASMGSDNGPTKPLVEVPESALQGVARTNLDHPKPTPAQRARRERSRARIAAMGAPFLDTLPVVEDAKAIPPRAAKEIAQRAVAVTLAAVKAEGLEQEIVLGVVKKWGAEAFLTREERKFLFDPKPSDRDRAKFSWRYEGLDVLLWALGLKDSLPPPNQIMDVPGDVELVKQNGAAGLAVKAKPRTMDELLDMNDLYYCLNWAAIELRLKGVANEHIDEGIVVERHYALNWLIRYMNQEWDDVTTDT